MAKDETELKRYARARHLGWSETYEPSLRGGGIGIPDTQFMLAHVLFPIEFKVGVIQDAHLIAMPRPSQISWHARFSRAGGIALVAVGVRCERDWMIYILPGGHIGNLREGVRIKDRSVRCVTPEQNFTKQLTDYINDEWQGILRNMDKRGKRD